MTDQDDIAAAEKRGYSKGYQAGRARRRIDIREERRRREREAFRRRAFLAALPACIAATGWQTNNKPINTLAERVALAWDFANESVTKV